MKKGFLFFLFFWERKRWINKYEGYEPKFHTAKFVTMCVQWSWRLFDGGPIFWRGPNRVCVCQKNVRHGRDPIARKWDAQMKPITIEAGLLLCEGSASKFSSKTSFALGDFSSSSWWSCLMIHDSKLACDELEKRRRRRVLLVKIYANIPHGLKAGQKQRGF